MEILKLYHLKIELELKKVCQYALSALDAGASEENTHDWSFFIRPSPAEIIEATHTHLNPTFWNDSVQQQDLISLL
ncbi:hypothetical protein PG984_009939 [Apiospora sp. TS-2023a]